MHQRTFHFYASLLMNKKLKPIIQWFVVKVTHTTFSVAKQKNIQG